MIQPLKTPVIKLHEIQHLPKLAAEGKAILVAASEIARVLEELEALRKENDKLRAAMWVLVDAPVVSE